MGGASTRFGSPKALARLGGETLAERGWRVLGEVCDERLAVGKAIDGLPLPFPLLDDGLDVRAPIAGVIAGLRAARSDLCLVLPVDCPLVTPEILAALAAGCGPEDDAAVPQTGPLPGAYRRSALYPLEAWLAAGALSLREAPLKAHVVELDPALLVNVNTPDELAELASLERGGAPRL